MWLVSTPLLSSTLFINFYGYLDPSAVGTFSGGCAAGKEAGRCAMIRV